MITTTLKNKTMLLSDEDADLLLLRWRLHNGYAYTKIKQVTATFHRLVLRRMAGRELLSGEQCDHLNGDKLDNQRTNLRIATRSENRRNLHKSASKSGLIGVRQSSDGYGWTAELRTRTNGIRTYLLCKRFKTRAEAIAAYNKAAEQHGFLTRNKE